MGELAALTVVSALFLFVGGGQFWQAAIMLTSACVWWVYGRPIKRTWVRRVAGCLAIGIALMGCTLVANAQYVGPSGPVIVQPATPAPGSNCQLVTVYGPNGPQQVMVCS